MEEVKIIPTQYGRGVAANRSWKEGEIIRISECIYLPDNQMPLKSQGSALWAYVFSAAKDGVLVSLDWTSLMNHSEDNFNVEYKPTDDNKIIFKAARDINPGDELLINYGYDVVDHNKHFGIDTDKLNEDTLQGFDMSASQGGVGLSSVRMHSEDEGQELIDALHNLKDQLFDAPDDIKEGFNSVVRYFDEEYFAFEGLKATWKSLRIAPLRVRLDKIKAEINQLMEKVNQKKKEKAKIQENIDKILGNR